MLVISESTTLIVNSFIFYTLKSIKISKDTCLSLSRTIKFPNLDEFPEKLQLAFAPHPPSLWIFMLRLFPEIPTFYNKMFWIRNDPPPLFQKLFNYWHATSLFRPLNIARSLNNRYSHLLLWLLFHFPMISTSLSLSSPPNKWISEIKISWVGRPTNILSTAKTSHLTFWASNMIRAQRG